MVVDRPEPGSQPAEVLRAFLGRDAELAERFGRLEPVRPVAVLGPLAVDASSAGVPGLFVVGDAAGFIDPMTGDGLNLAMRGALLAADESMRVLESGDWSGAVERLNRRRMQAIGAKLRFNRWVRALTSSPAAIRGAVVAAKIAPALLRRLIVEAGDAA